MYRLILQLTTCLLSAVSYAQKQLTNLPTIYITTADGTDITSKETYKTCKLVMVDGDSVTVYDSLGIRGRGNSTWNNYNLRRKPPYRIKFGEKQKFLGKGYAKAKSWTLLSNHSDKSLIRNALTRELGIFVGMPFNPAAKFVDLYLNNFYRGCYQISDQIEVRPHRVNITEQPKVVTDTTDISGGYLLEVEGAETYDNTDNYFTTGKGLITIVHSPDKDYITPAQNWYIKEHISDFENRLFGYYFAHPTLGYRPYVDTTQLINWYIALEMKGDPDAFYSAYYYKEKGDQRLHFGPIWDSDIAYANCNRVGDTSEKLMSTNGFGSMKIWTNKMWQDPWFAASVNRRWKQLVANGIESYLIRKIDSIAAVVDQSQKMNYKVWSISQRTYNEIYLHSSYEDYIADLRTFVTAHVAYLTKIFDNKETLTDINPIYELKTDYRLVYNCDSRTISFKGTDVDISAQLFNMGGVLMAEFTNTYNASALAHGTYIIRYKVDGRQRSVKINL